MEKMRDNHAKCVTLDRSVNYIFCMAASMTLVPSVEKTIYTCFSELCTLEILKETLAA